MASYSFRLKNILNLKERVEDNKKNELGKAQKRLQSEKEKCKLLILALNSAKENMDRETKEGINIDRMKVLLQNINFYKESIKKQNLAVKMAEEYLDICRVELIKATQEKKTMERLKDKDYMTYLYNEQKKEEKLVDELVSFKQSNR